MALTESSEKLQESQKEKKEKPQTKIIVRRLPPSMTQEEFLLQVAPIPEYDYIYNVKGDMSLGENSFSRVYINFCKYEDVYMFKEKFDNYVFVDTKGHEYPAVVEYASFQKIPKRRKARPDPKIGSIESDPVYLEFVKSLEEQPATEKPEYSYNPSTENKNDITTPLLDYLKQRKMDKMRIREEKREERRRKEIERKKIREDDRRKRMEEKTVKNPPTKTVLKESEAKSKEVEEVGTKEEKEEEKFVKKEKKSEDRKPKPKYSKYEEKNEYKSRREDYREFSRSKYDDKKYESKEYPKKVKKYSERREERKFEANKVVEQKKEEIKHEEPKEEIKKESKSDENNEEGEKGNRNKENDPRVQRRIRNKDRPAMVLYKPGMLRKKSVDSDGKEEKSTTVEEAE